MSLTTFDEIISIIDHAVPYLAHKILFSLFRYSSVALYKVVRVYAIRPLEGDGSPNITKGGQQLPV